MFHAIEGLSVIEQQAANVRQFVGDGTPFLRVPNLSKVLAVRVGAQPLPLVIRQKFPVDASQTNFIEVDSPLVILQNLADGTPVLLRSIQSNDGYWQSAVPIFVQGEWDDVPVEASAPVEPPKDNKSEPPAK